MSSIRSVLIFLTLVALTIEGFSQEDPRQLARDYFDLAQSTLEATQALDQARDLFVLAAETDTTFVRANFEAGHIHIVTIGKDLAVKYFLRVYRQDPGYRFDIEFWIGKSYQYGLDFDNALLYYNRYKEKLNRNAGYQGRDRVAIDVVERGIRECENGKLYVDNPGNYSIVNIGREINSEFDDYGPVMNEREDEIVFTSRRREDNSNENVDVDNLPYEDIFTAKKTAGKWAFATNVGPPVNTLYHESNLAMSPDGSTLFIYNDVGGGDIMACERHPDGTWGPPIGMPGVINSSYQEKSITISKDEKTLFFVSNRPNGQGGTDIYRATKNNQGQWSNVRNLGPKINTPRDEEGPFIDYDGVTLYFSSTGHLGGMGGHDIYRSTYDPQSDQWSDPVNMGYPINTPDNDVYFIVSADNKRAYYSSVREDGMGYTDIYMISSAEGFRNIRSVTRKEPPKEPVIATVRNDPPPAVIRPLKYVVKVQDAQTKNPLAPKIRLQGQRDNIIVASRSMGGGVYEFTINEPEAKDYTLSVELDGYVFQNQNLRLQGAGTEEQTINRTIEMRKLSVGVTSILRNIYFDYDKATFKTESYPELNKLDAMLRQNSRIKVEISGHTDAYGRWDYNRTLSQKRAEAVKDYLTKKGIDPRRVKAVGYGESRPLASNDDEADGRELNRRVEFKVLPD